MNVTMGVFEGASLKATWRFASDHAKLADEYGVLILTLLAHDGIAPGDVKEAVMASVVPDLDPIFERVI